ncbi:septum formation initiator family protein [Candidatus Nomurabacteria bacterium]|nr:septum formation initiator family protein [Candidatus Nomurabacteria bacterium]
MIKRPSNLGWRRWLYTRVSIVAIALVALLLGRAGWQVFWKQRLVINDRAQVESELSALMAREQKLRAEIDLLKSESGLEGKIREKFSVVKEGEKVIAIVARDKATTSTTTAERRSWWPF